MSNTYFIRTTDKDTLLDLAVQIGLLIEDEGQHYMADPHAGIWDPIGPIYRPTGGTVSTEMGDVPEMVVVADSNGTPYWHANLLLYELSLGDMARAAYAADPTPELAQALQSIPLYFVADQDGTPVAPTAPARVFG